MKSTKRYTGSDKTYKALAPKAKNNMLENHSNLNIFEKSLISFYRINKLIRPRMSVEKKSCIDDIPSHRTVLKKERLSSIALYRMSMASLLSTTIRDFVGKPSQRFRNVRDISCR